jgi:hypothetical protein
MCSSDDLSASLSCTLDATQQICNMNMNWHIMESLSTGACKIPKAIITSRHTIKVVVDVIIGLRSSCYADHQALESCSAVLRAKTPFMNE